MTLVPRTKLIIWAAITFLPVSVLVAVTPALTVPCIGLAALMLFISATDAAISKSCLAGIRVMLPEVIRLSAGRDGNLILSIDNDPPKARQLRVGLALPREVYSSHQDILADLPPETSNSQMIWPFKAMKQGRYYLENCYLETPSNLGFWSLRKAQTVHTEIRVYPDLFGERKQLTGLFLNRGIGIHAQRQVGKGREFEQLREYLPGDSYEDIHWKATARRRQPITKVYQIERTQQIYVIIDGSRLSARNSDRRHHGRPNPDPVDETSFTTILERFTIAALVMGLAADRQGDLFGMLAFDNRVKKFVPAKNGRAHYNTCRDALYTLRAQRVTPDFEELFTFIAAKIRRRALLIFLTNLDDPVLAESFTSNIALISRQHMIVVNMLKPGGATPLFSDSDVNSLNDIYDRLGGHILWRHLRETDQYLHRHGIGFYLLQNENLCTDVVTQYLSIKRRQIL